MSYFHSDRRRQPRRQRQIGRRGHGGSRRRSCPEVVVRWIAASEATSADSSTATGTRSSARRAGGALVADASRHDRALRTRARRGSVRRLFHVPTYLFFHLREEGAACVNARTRPYAPQIYKYGHDSARRISNNRAGKIPSMTESPGRDSGELRRPPPSSPSRALRP